MLCRDLKVVNLIITEDEYRYDSLFRLCTETTCMETDVDGVSSGKKLQEIKECFGIEETCDEIREILMDKIMEASSIESRNIEGETCCGEVDDREIQNNIDSLSVS